MMVGPLTQASLADAPLTQALEALRSAAAAVATADPGDLPGPALTEALAVVATAQAQLAAARARLVARIDADGTWAVGGARSLPAWIRERTGDLEQHAARTVREARMLRDHLPRAARALAAGDITADHVTVLVRAVDTSPLCKEALADPDMGEEWLIARARELDASRFNTLVKNWAVRADPEAADRRWKDESEREELSLGKTLDGYHGRFWLTDSSGGLLRTALDAWAGKPATGDMRTAAQRRAAALIELVGATLDAGTCKPGARIRPHLAVTAGLDTLLATTAAQEPGRTADDVVPTEDQPPEEAPIATIATSLDYTALRGTAPATLEDGTPIPFALFARLACESHLHRVVFGADGEILDVGREERLFTRGQTRGILARDGHCQFPGCTAPPGVGEIHHSLWWYAHHGPTDATNGILLCRYHHTYVHQRELTIKRYPHHWRFTRPDGTTLGETPIDDPFQPKLE